MRGCIAVLEADFVIYPLDAQHYESDIHML